jgi:hypothetical protein
MVTFLRHNPNICMAWRSPGSVKNPSPFNWLSTLPRLLIDIARHHSSAPNISFTHTLTRRFTTLPMASPLKAAADPVERTASPYSNPYELSPKAKILASRTSNYHSTSLRMVTSSSFRIFPSSSSNPWK